mgnify:CR=1 FL=1
MNQAFVGFGSVGTDSNVNVPSQVSSIEAVTNDLLTLAKMLASIQERVGAANIRVSGPRPREVTPAPAPNGPPTLTSITSILLSAAAEIDGELRRLVG